MGDMIATETALEEAIAIIDEALKAISGRDIVSTSEMSDLLLDARLKLNQSN